jgi:hypothetical protein
VSVLSDGQIAAMSPAERRQLIRRLERPLSELMPAAVARRILYSITGTLRLFRFTAIRMWLLEPSTPLWRLPLLP